MILTVSGLILLVILISILFIVCIRYRQLKEKHKKVMDILSIGKNISINIKLQKLIEDIVETAKNLALAEACSLYLVDEEKQELFFNTALGEKGHLLKEIRIKIGQGVAGTVAQVGETLNIPDISKDTRFNKSRKIAKDIEFKEKAILTLPIKSKNKVIGVLQFINKQGGGEFTKEDEELIQMLIDFQVVSNLEKSQLYERLRQTFVDSIESMASAIDAKDIYTQGHCRRVSENAFKIGRCIGLNPNELEALKYAGILHDIGKIGIKDAILNKQGPLDDDEFQIMKTHPVVGDTILRQISTLEQSIRDAARYHHERYDGMGYYEGLKGEQIPLFARILAIADTYDAITTDRPYRKGLAKEVALEEIRNGEGTQFDPELAEVFIRLMEESKEIK
ncbi:MAG: putative domain HDIG-containing protein [Clostridia bacterium]|jgi:HD-GYP domain-containing protein (c-di-GMP phosphodiesterase class II)|nr:putative domain HDIG-containing protein [Clostridia bacterium]